jgi:Family of unknown function (DUF5335)
MVNKIDISKSVPRERWGEFFDQFSDGNRGRHISIEVIDSELGDRELIQDAPLMAMIYDLGYAEARSDRPGKGDDLTIEVGRDEVTYAHTIVSPTEVLTGQNSNGKMMAISIADSAGTKTLIKLQAS